MPTGEIGFCPFCRESFEGERRCPEHELELVGFDKLGPDPADPDQAPPFTDTDPVPPLTLGLGRGWIGLGALLGGLSLLVEMVPGAAGQAGLRGYELAVRIPLLWTAWAVAFLLVYVLRSRRSPRQMRSLRVAVPFLGLALLGAAGWALYCVLSGTLLSQAVRVETLRRAPGWGMYLLAAASLCVLVGGIRFGVDAKRRGADAS